MPARVRCNIPKCTCRRSLGSHQAIYEQRILNGETPIDILEDLGLSLLCCRINMLYPPTFPVMDHNSGKISDEVGILKQGTGFMKESSYIDGPLVYLADIPDLPF